MKKKMKVLISAILIGVLMFGGCAPAKDAKNETTNTKKEKTEKKAELSDGTYLADFKTDSGMFHVSEACDGKGTLTVKDGEMTIHISLTSKKIVNLYPGLAKDAEKEIGRAHV